MDVSTARAAANIVSARRRTRRIPGIPAEHAPENLLEAYAIQDKLVETLSGRTAGWKIGCTNEIARQQLGVDEPFRGRVFKAGIHQSPAELSASDTFMRVVETELAFRLARDVPFREGPYTAETIEPAVADLVPSLEIVDSVWEDWESVGAHHLIADNACHAALVLGEPSPDWRDVDLAAYEVSVSMNGGEALHGKGANVLGHPFNALAWLANDLASLGRELKAGEIVSTGVLTGLLFAEAGDTITADYGRFGKIEVTFVE